MKPDAPSEVRGPFQPIQTNVPGTQISECLPNTAKIADKIAIVRSVTSPLGEHGIAHHYLLTGYKPSPVLDYPSYGAVVAHVRGGEHTLPPYIAIPDYRSNAGSGFLGTAYRPFAVGGDPAKPDFRVRNLDFYPGVTGGRMERRREFVTQLERFQQEVDAGPPKSDPGFEQAYRLATSPKAKQAFDLTQEKPAVRARYGPRTVGQSCLLARRLVEAGVSFVTVNNTGWDTHDGLDLRLKEGYTGAKIGVGLVPLFDMAFAAQASDLSERGLLDDTLVVAMGEFGRTPKLNTRGGRDHWPRVFSVAMAGGGIKGGQVYGSSDHVGEARKTVPSRRPTWPTRCTLARNRPVTRYLHGDVDQYRSTRAARQSGAACMRARPLLGSRCREPRCTGRSARRTYGAGISSSGHRWNSRARSTAGHGIAFSDGKSVVVGSQAGMEVRSWPELQPVRTLPTELVNIHDLGFSPDGKTLAAAGGIPGKRGTVELYRWPDGKLLHRVSPHRDLIHAVAWRADSAVFATASADRSVGIHETASAKTIQTLEGHSRGVLAVAFLPGNGGVVSAGIDESLRLWDADSGKLLRTLPNHTRAVTDLKVRPGGNSAAPPLVVSVGDDRTVRLWQPTLGRLMRFVRLESAARAVAWTPDGQSLLAACKDGKLRVIDPDTVEVRETLAAVDGVAHSLAVAPDSSILVGGQHGQLRRLALASTQSAPAKKSYGKIELLRDPWGIPHVFSASDEGAMYGLGYAVAEDRGLQMHYSLRMIQGRLAEVIGNRHARSEVSALDNDRKMRTFGYYRVAKTVAAKVDADTRGLLQAYCDGVNDYFANHRDTLHPLFAKLDLKPEPWTPADCIASWWHLAQFFAGDGTGKLVNYRELANAQTKTAKLVFEDSAAVVGEKDVSRDWIDRVKQFHREHNTTPVAPTPRDRQSPLPVTPGSWAARNDHRRAVLVSDPQRPC